MRIISIISILLPLCSFATVKTQPHAIEYTYDANGNLASDLNKGITRIAYNQIGLPRSVEFADGHLTEYLYDASGRKLQTKYLLANFIAIEGPVIGDIGIELGKAVNPSISSPNSSDDSWVVIDPGTDPGMEMPIEASRYNTLAKRDYCGDYIYFNDVLQRINTPIGYMAPTEEYDSEYPEEYYYSFLHHAYVKDYQGNIRSVVNENGDVVEINQYYPYGGILYDGYTTRPAKSSAQPYKYSGKEYDTNNGLNLYDFHARQQDPYAPGFLSQDKKAGDYPWLSPYAYCAGNPIMYIDTDGNAWRPTIDKRIGKGEYTGYQWVDPANSYSSDGMLLPGLYEQAIFFSNEGQDGKKFNPDSDYNMGSSIATVYKADGTTEEFNACTYPSDIKKYPTVPEGIYEAKLGMHKGQYEALRLGDVGTKDFGSNTIELGVKNLAHTETTLAEYINIHKPGKYNKTGMCKNGDPISEGCILIDRDRWKDFISIFNKDTKISVTISRHLAAPNNLDINKPSLLQPLK